MDFIRQNINLLSVEKLAAAINRTVAPVERYIKEQHLVSVEMDNRETTKTNLRSQLHARGYWVDVKNQLIGEEIQRFEENWLELFMQFRGDILYTEELDIKQYIILEISMNRTQIARKEAMLEEERIKKQLNEEYSKDEKNENLIANLESQLGYARAALPAYATEYTKLLEKRQKLSETLKANREQRIKKIEDSRKTWLDLMKALDNEELRERLGADAAITNLAGGKAKDNLSELHTYVDGAVDIPLLNSDTVKKNI